MRAVADSDTTEYLERHREAEWLDGIRQLAVDIDDTFFRGYLRAKTLPIGWMNSDDRAAWGICYRGDRGIKLSPALITETCFRRPLIAVLVHELVHVATAAEAEDHGARWCKRMTQLGVCPSTNFIQPRGPLINGCRCAVCR